MELAKDIQGDYKLCKRLYKFIGMKVIATQKQRTQLRLRA
jgi:hypothetical protein